MSLLVRVKTLFHCYFSKCCILSLDLDKQWRTRIFKDKILYFYSFIVTLVWSRRAVGESFHTQRSCWKSEQLVESEFQPKFLSLYSLKTPTQPCLFTHIMLAFHWPWFTLIQCLFFVGHGLYLCIFLCLGYHVHALLVFHWSWLTPTDFFMPQVSWPYISAFPVVTLFILLTTRCISQILLLAQLAGAVEYTDCISVEE